MPARPWTSAVVFATCLVASVAFLPSHPEAATFHGQVVDTETGEPLEAAAVVIVWRRYPYVPRMDGGTIGGSWTDPAEVVTVSFRMSRRGDIARGMACDHLAPNIGFRLCRMERHTHWGGAS